MEALPPGWLITAKLAESKWLTDSVRAAMDGHLNWARQMEGQDVIDKELVRWAELAYGSRALENSNLLPQLRTAFATIKPLRFEHWIKPLAIENSYSHVPPATMVPHSNARVTPYIATFSDKNGEGRLILIDPLNHIFLAPICCALLIVACYDLSGEHFTMILDFIIATSAYYSSDREKTEALLNHKEWNEESEKLMHEDKTIGPIAEKMAFNILGFAFYHEVSHSILGHVGRANPNEVQIGEQLKPISVFTAQQQQELDADTCGYGYFKQLVVMSHDAEIDWTGNQYDHAPLIFFRILGLLQMVGNKLKGRVSNSGSHPRPIQRYDLLKNQIGSLSTEGQKLHHLMTSALDRVENVIEAIDLRHYLRNIHLLTGVQPMGL